MEGQQAVKEIRTALAARVQKTQDELNNRREEKMLLIDNQPPQ